MRIIVLMLALLVSHAALAQENPVLGHWKLNTVLQDGRDITTSESGEYFWTFHKDGTVEYFDMRRGRMRSVYTFDGMVITIQSPDWYPDGWFRVIRLDPQAMEWEVPWIGMLVYKLQRIE